MASKFSKLTKIYVGTFVNRDLEVFRKIKKFSELHYNISFVNLFKKGIFSVKNLRKKLKKYPLSLIIVKLYSEESNQKIYDALNTYASHIPRLNSVRSVNTCESRKATFKLIDEKCKRLIVPKSYYSINAAYDAISRGIPLIIKLDTHNIKNLSKFDRIIGVARTPKEFLKITGSHNTGFIEARDIIFKKLKNFLGKLNLL